MGVDATNKEYAVRAPQWLRCRDVTAGQDAVHKAGERYLPRLKDQDQAEYDAYVARALLFNATARTVEGLVGMVFRKPPMMKVPEALKAVLDDITMTGVPLVAFAEIVVEEVVSVGRYGVLVDFPRVDGAPATKAEAEASGNRPFMVGYAAESILDWKQERIGNRMTLIQVRLMEAAEVAKDEFTTEDVPQIRVLDLVGAQYQVRLFQKVKEGGKDQWQQVGGTIVPLKNGAPLTEIPFVFFGVRDLTPTACKPPLLDLVQTNIDHYKMMADYRHGLHFTGLPTAVVSGYNATEDDNGNTEKLYIGSTTAWVFPDPTATATFLEFTGQGLTALKDAIREDEERMAAQGARMLAPEKRATETAETAAIHRAGEASVLASLAISCGRALTKAVNIVADWSGAAGEVKIDLNTDFYPITMTPEQLTALVAGWMQGAISKETLFENLKGGEIIRASAQFEDEEAKIAGAPPMGGLLQAEE